MISMAPLLIPESLVVQLDPLSDEVRMLTDPPPVMNVLFPKEIDRTTCIVPEVALTQVVPLSVEVTIKPVEPTATKVSFPNVTA